MTKTEELERRRKESFICQCGRSLCFEWGEGGQVRVACYSLVFQGKHCSSFLTHDEPTQWCSTREEAEAVWKMINVLSQP
jgi:hypothetical protein